MLCGSEMKGSLHWSITSFGYLGKAGLKKLRWVKPAVIIFFGLVFWGGRYLPDFSSKREVVFCSPVPVQIGDCKYWARGLGEERLRIFFFG